MGICTVFMGTPQFAVPILDSLVHSPYRVVAVYTQPDKPAGRGRSGLTYPPVKSLAIEHDIPIIQPQTLESAEVVTKLTSLNPELIVVAAFGHILPRPVLSLPRFGCINVHPSLLPRHRGPSPVPNAILCGDQVTGVTIMLMDAGMDSGPILAQKSVDISPEDTAGVLTSKLAHIGAELLLETLSRWIQGELEPEPQNKSQATYSRLIRSGDGEMDWHLTAEELWRRTRAYDPWPGCYTWWRGKRLKILAAVPLGEVVEGEVGKVVALSGAAPWRVGIVTGKGVLGLRRVQLEGKREMPVEEFVRGQRDFVGSILS